MTLFMPITPLFVPGTRYDRFDQAIKSGADTIIIDLEDSVSESQKQEARENLLGFDKQNCNLFVRVNDLDSPFVEDDLACLEKCGEVGIMLSKSEDPHAITQWLERHTFKRKILCLHFYKLICQVYHFQQLYQNFLRYLFFLTYNKNLINHSL